MKKTSLLTLLVATLMVFGFTVSNVQAQGAVVGAVVDAEGNAVEGAMVALHGMEHDRGERPFMAQTETDADGAFEFADVPAGNYIINAGAPDLGGVREEIEVADDQVTRLALQLQGVCDDEGREGDDQNERRRRWLEDHRRGGDNGGGRGEFDRRRIRDHRDPDREHFELE